MGLKLCESEHLDCTTICVKNRSGFDALITIDLSDIYEIESNSQKAMQKLVRRRGFESLGVARGLKRENWEKIRVIIEKVKQ